VCVDGSSGGDATLSTATKLLNKSNEIVVFSVGPTDYDIPNNEVRAKDNATLEHTKNIVEQRIAAAKNAGFSSVTGKWVLGFAREQIMQELTDEKYDLCIVGARGLGIVTSILLGSVSDYLVRNAPCDVIVAKKH